MFLDGKSPLWHLGLKSLLKNSSLISGVGERKKEKEPQRDVQGQNHAWLASVSSGPLDTVMSKTWKVML